MRKKENANFNSLHVCVFRTKQH